MASSSSVTNKSIIGLIFVLVTMLIWTRAVAQSDCDYAIMNMASCLDYVRVGSNPSSIPSSSCCSALASVVESQPQCLCTLLSASSVYDIPIDQQLVRALPGACNVQTPPISLCDGGSTTTYN